MVRTVGLQAVEDGFPVLVLRPLWILDIDVVVFHRPVQWSHPDAVQALLPTIGELGDACIVSLDVEWGFSALYGLVRRSPHRGCSVRLCYEVVEQASGTIYALGPGDVKEVMVFPVTVGHS